MKIEIGKEYKIKKGCERECGSYRTAGGASIEVHDITDDGHLRYHILDTHGNKVKSCFCCFESKHLIPAQKDITDINTYEVGDIIEGAHGVRQVLGICGLAVIISISGDCEKADSVYTTQELASYGYKFKDQPAEITEMTLEEVAELKGIPVEQLRIKE